MKKRPQKSAKGEARPKLDRAAVEALVRDLSRPERLAREAENLLRRLRDDPALAGLRFGAEALERAALEEGELARSRAPRELALDGRGDDASGAERQPTVDRIVDRLVTEEVRAGARAVLEARAREGGTLEEMIPYRVGMHLLDAEKEAKRAASKNPFWLGVLSASVHELPLALYVGSRSAADLEAEAAGGRASAAFGDFLESDARVRAFRRAIPQLDLESILIHAMLGFGEAHEIALPLDAALAGPVEAARAARRRRALAGVGSAGPVRDEQAKTLMAAVEKDKDRAVPAYREELLERFREAAREVAAPATAMAGRARLEKLFAMLVALEAMPPSRNVPLMGAYEVAGPRALEEAGEREKPLLHAILGRPLDPAGYRAYAERLIDLGRPRARAFAEAALAAFPDDGMLAALAERARGAGTGA